MDGADIWVKETKHIVQPYRVIKKRGLVAVDALGVHSAAAARARAQKLYETGHYAGVDAFTVSSDPEAGVPRQKSCEKGTKVSIVRVGFSRGLSNAERDKQGYSGTS